MTTDLIRRQDAIEAFAAECEGPYEACMQVAVELFKDIPSATMDGDLIDRNELLRDLNIAKETLEYSIEHYDDTEIESAKDKFGLYLLEGWIDTVKGYSSARATGRWKKIPKQEHLVKCSICGSTSIENSYKFCPHCGAEMEAEDGLDR